MTGLTYDTLNNNAFNRLTIVSADANGNFLWRKDYGNFKFEYLENIFVSRSLILSNNGFYFYSAVRDSNNKYFSVLIKFAFNGDTLWQRKYYDPVDKLYIQGVTKSVDNGFLMTGLFEGAIETCLLIKTDSLGNELWRKKIAKGSAPNTQAGFRVVQDTLSKKIIVAGYQYNYDGTQPGGFSSYANIILTDSLGVLLNKTVYSGSCGSGFYDLIQSNDKNYIAVGYKDQCNNLSGPLGDRRNKSYLVKFGISQSNIFSTIYTKEFDTLSAINCFSTINELNNGDLILCGTLDTLRNYNILEKGMLRVIKLDHAAKIKWKRYLSRDNITENSKEAKSLNRTVNGGFIIANKLAYANNPKPYSITKIDSTGCDSTEIYCQTLSNINAFSIYKNQTFHCYPNPSNGALIIEAITNTESTSYLIKIFDLFGQVVFYKEIDLKNKAELNLKTLVSGLYSLHIYKNNSQVSSTKIIIK